LCQGWHAFLQSPDKWTSIWYHDETVQMECKKQGITASDGKLIDIVVVAVFVLVDKFDQ
jgi:hypothetical protein